MTHRPDWYLKEWRQAKRGLTIVYMGLFDRNRSGSEDPANVPVCIFSSMGEAQDMLRHLKNPPSLIPGHPPIRKRPLYHQEPTR